MTEAKQLTLELDDKAGPSRKESWKLFNRIAHRYDLLNRVLSLRRDVAWRRKMLEHLPPADTLKVVDLATGTGDQLIVLAQGSPAVKEGVGVDMSENMLAVGRCKLEALGLSEAYKLEQGDATDLPLSSNDFDVATISFGIRNVVAVPDALREMHRVLRPGGRVLILEFSMPQVPVARGFYLFYLRHVLPRIGGLVSGDSFAYRYLNKTVETFPYGDAFRHMLEEAGFVDTAAQSLCLGVATIYRGDKPQPSGEVQGGV